MSSRLTVADVRRAIGSLFSASDFIPYLNQAIDAIKMSGRWSGDTVLVTFNSSPGFITLPYDYIALLGVNTGRWVPPIFSRNHFFIEAGPGRVPASGQYNSMLVDMGDGYCTWVEPPEDQSTLRIVLESTSDYNKGIRLYGYSGGIEISDSNGRGTTVTPVALTTNIATPIDLNSGMAITGIECPVDTSGYPTMVAPWSLYSVSPTTGDATLLARYTPQDRRPCYRRYQTGQYTTSIQCLCKKRFIPVYKETDFVDPGNIQAIKAAMQAIANQDPASYVEAAQMWDRVFNALEAELKNERGNIVPIIPFNKNPQPNPIRFVR